MVVIPVYSNPIYDVSNNSRSILISEPVLPDSGDHTNNPGLDSPFSSGTCGIGSVPDIGYNEAEITGYSVPWSGVINGTIHVYQVIVAPGITWVQARSATERKGGHLATITSTAENELVFSHINNASYWSSCRGNIFGPWLGGYQPSESDIPGIGWVWVTGEQWDYTNWYPEEPNDYGGEEDRLYFYGNNCMLSSSWGDHRNDGDGVTAYIIEWEDEIPVSPCHVGAPPSPFRPVRTKQDR